MVSPEYVRCYLDDWLVLTQSSLNKESEMLKVVGSRSAPSCHKVQYREKKILNRCSSILRSNS